MSQRAEIVVFALFTEEMEDVQWLVIQNLENIKHGLNQPIRTTSERMGLKMANFSAYGTVTDIIARGQGCEVVILEAKAKSPIKVYCFGTAPRVGDEVVCIGYINGNEGKDGKMYNNVNATSFGIVQHSTKAADFRPSPPRPQQSQRMPEQSPFDDESESLY